LVLVVVDVTSGGGSSLNREGVVGVGGEHWGGDGGNDVGEAVITVWTINENGRVGNSQGLSEGWVGSGIIDREGAVPSSHSSWAYSSLNHDASGSDDGIVEANVDVSSLWVVYNFIKDVVSRRFGRRAEGSKA